MSKQWPTVRLAEVLRHRKEFITIDDLTNYRRPRVQLHAQGIVLRDDVPGALIKTKAQQVCRTGEFLVAEIDAKVGGFGIVPKTLDGSIVSSVTGRIKTSHLGSNQNQPPWVLRHLKHRCAPCGKFNLRPARACSLAVTGSFWHRG